MSDLLDLEVFVCKGKDITKCNLKIINIALTVHSSYLTHEELLSPGGEGRLMSLHVGCRS